MMTQTYWFPRKTSIFWLIVTLMVLAACQAEARSTTEGFVGSWQSDGRGAERNITDQAEPSITAEALIGRWQSDDMNIPGLIIEFKEDGTYNVGAYEFGTFQLEDTLLTLTSTDEDLFCFAGTPGTYEVELTKEGQLHWTLRDDDCFDRSQWRNNTLWSRTSS